MLVIVLVIIQALITNGKRYANYPIYIPTFMKKEIKKEEEIKVPATQSVVTGDIEIIPVLPKGKSVWKMGSTYPVSWSLKGLPTDKEFFMTVFLLKADELEGSILMEPTQNGVTSATYTVGIINIGSDALVGISPGTYQVAYRIYKPQGSASLGYGEMLIEKKGAFVTIE